MIQVYVVPVDNKLSQDCNVSNHTQLPTKWDII